jgi:curved DNA-binding protein CbpA
MAGQWDRQTYYEILEVSSDAPESEIRRAYQRAKATYSQDNPALYSVFTKDETKALLGLIDEAFSVLSNNSSRKAYDQSLSRRSDDMSVTDQFVSRATRGELGPTQEEHLPEFSFDESAFGKAPNAPPPQRDDADPFASKAVVVPAGHQKTSVSVYPVNQELEDRIAQQFSFDGPFLKEIRLYKKVEMDQMVEITRIGRNYLQAIEANDYKSLPAPVFVRGFIVQVARVLGLDENRVAKSYMDILKQSKPL